MKRFDAIAVKPQYHSCKHVVRRERTRAENDKPEQGLGDGVIRLRNALDYCLVLCHLHSLISWLSSP